MEHGKFGSETAEILREKARGYGWPKFGHAAELKSLAYHANQRRNLKANPMAYHVHHRVVSTVLEDLKEARWELPNDFLSFDRFQKLLSTVDMNSSPGYPYMLQAPTNRIFFNASEEGVVSESNARAVYELVLERIKERGSDPIRLFIKPEPLSQAKLEDHRYRLISSVSIIDQLIDTLLFHEFTSKLVEKCQETPVKTGWTPLKGGWRTVPKIRMRSTDKRSWDWTVNEWLLDVLLEVIYKLGIGVTKEWIELAKWRFKELFKEPIFITSGGFLFQQLYPGVMKSGCKLTIAGNSVMQMILHYRVAIELGLPPPNLWAMGDDVIEDEQEDEYYELLSKYCILKEIHSHIEFAGFRFGNDYIEPIYPGKHAFMLLHQDEKNFPETADSYALLYNRSIDGPRVKSWLRELKNDIPDDVYLDLIWNGY